MTLTLTFTTIVDNEPLVTTYNREYPSLEEFLADYAEAYNEQFGEDNWSVVEKS